MEFLRGKQSRGVDVARTMLENSFAKFSASANTDFQGVIASRRNLVIVFEHDDSSRAGIPAVVGNFANDVFGRHVQISRIVYSYTFWRDPQISRMPEGYVARMSLGIRNSNPQGGLEQMSTPIEGIVSQKDEMILAPQIDIFSDFFPMRYAIRRVRYQGLMTGGGKVDITHGDINPRVVIALARHLVSCKYTDSLGEIGPRDQLRPPARLLERIWERIMRNAMPGESFPVSMPHREIYQRDIRVG